MIKKLVLGIIGAIFALNIGLWVLLMLPPSPFKVTDPNHPKFNIEKFEFSDYDARDFKETMDILIPKGTPKSNVDNILIRKGGAKYSLGNDNNHRYFHDSWQETISKPFEIFPWGYGCGSYSVSICFDNENKLVRADYHAPCRMTIGRTQCK